MTVYLATPPPPQISLHAYKGHVYILLIQAAFDRVSKGFSSNDLSKKNKK